MSKSKHFDKSAYIITALMLVLTILFINGSALGLEISAAQLGYESRLFDNSKVHTIDIVIDDFDDFIANAESEEYRKANIVIDGEAYKNVAIRTKGNTSLSSVASLGSERYSFKIEFDHYDSSKTYYGLDKLCLNNLIHDSTMMKDYLTYTLMNEFGVATPLCSYVYITINGEEWGLYLALEGVEDAFLRRNYGGGDGNLYKPDSQSAGGGQSMNSSDVKLIYSSDDFDDYVNIFDNAKTDITNEDKIRLIDSLKRLSAQKDIGSTVDIDEVIRYFVVHNYVSNGDSYTGSMVHNYYLYEENGILSMIPWDYNLAFGTFNSRSADSAVNSPIDSPVENDSAGDRPMWNWIVSNTEYTNLYHEYFADFLSEVDITGIIDNTYELIREYVKNDPTAFYDNDEFTLGVKTLRDFCSMRSESILMQLENGETVSNQNYVDASSLTLSDMGTMGGMGEQRGDFQKRDMNVRDPFAQNERENKNGSDIPAFSGFDSERFDLPQDHDITDPSEITDDTLTDSPSFEKNDMRGEVPDFDVGGPQGKDRFENEAPAEHSDRNESTGSKSNYTEWIWLALSALTLALGLIVVKKYP